LKLKKFERTDLTVLMLLSQNSLYSKVTVLWSSREIGGLIVNGAEILLFATHLDQLWRPPWVPRSRAWS